jgi:hypothetical protein
MIKSERPNFRDYSKLRYLAAVLLMIYFKIDNLPEAEFEYCQTFVVIEKYSFNE